MGSCGYFKAKVSTPPKCRDINLIIPLPRRNEDSAILFETGRLVSVDRVRGLVMVLMALDHVRWFFTDEAYSPTDLQHTHPALFFTRWATHFCAPAFVFLAGAGAFLFTTRGTGRPALVRFLLARGLWLVLLELTLVHWAWTFRLNFQGIHLGVLWAIGWSMVALAGLVYLPRLLMAILALVLIGGHDLADGLNLDDFRDSGGGLSGMGWLVSFLHIPHAPVLYPLIPWVGVMMAGYAFGPLLLVQDKARRRALAAGGITLVAAFIALRASNVYGDPRPWSLQPDPVFSVLSFLNTGKYPPSLLYLLMTLGPILLALAWSPEKAGPVSRFLVVFGRAPLFFYLAHLYLIHGLVLLVAAVQGREVAAFLASFSRFPDAWGFGLPAVYGFWLAVILILYLPCRNLARIKARHRGRGWTGYI